MMRDVILDLFGTYSPVTYNNGSFDIIPDGLSGVDWVFVSGVFLFALSLYCAFRVIGGILKNVISR